MLGVEDGASIWCMGVHIACQTSGDIFSNRIIVGGVGGT